MNRIGLSHFSDRSYPAPPAWASLRPIHAHASSVIEDGTLHVIFGTSQLVLLPFAALLINLGGLQEPKIGKRAQGFALDRWPAIIWLLGLCGVHSHFCGPHGPARLRLGRHRLDGLRASLSLRTCCGS